MRKAKLKYPRSFKVLRVIAWILVPLYFLRGCDRVFQWGCGVIPSTSDCMLMTFVGLFIFVFITPVKRTLLYIGRGKPRKRITAGAVWLILLTMIFLHVFISQKNSKTKRLEWIFKRFIADPVPQSVEITEGAFFGFQDKTGWLIFKAPQQTFQELTSSYKLLPADKIKYREHFPSDVVNPTFYYRTVCKENYCDGTFLIWDKDNLKCHVDIMPHTSSSSDDDDFRCLHSKWTEPTPEATDAFIERSLERRARLKKPSPEEIIRNRPDITLAEAVRMNNLELVKLLLQKGTDINEIKNSNTLLEKAVSYRNYEMAKLLIENGAPVNCSILHKAISRGSFKKEFVKLLLENGADDNSVIAYYKTKLGSSKDVAIGATALMYAVLKDDIELVELLIEYGADVNGVSEKPKYTFPGSIEITPLEIARKKGFARIEKILLEAGATQ